ncbi:hypothetical protein LCGC14_1357050 [marine sediment metagenome]|uniref:DNA-directed RNA polymerase n=1 Tax=marine sediment metagenome TaxID=412755 RepID=A0A0F9K961_9ZZZZ
MDGRLGTLEPGQKCLTCGNTAARCPGHFGHIELAEPILHIAFIDNIYKLLLSTCRSCSRLKVPQEDLDEFAKITKREAAYSVISQKRIPEQILEKAKKAKECPHCGKTQYELIFTKPTIFIEKTEIGEHRLLPVTIRERFSQILDDDLILLRYDPATARPEWFILQVMPVPPVTVRPSIILETGIRSEDDLTHKMVDIIRVNQRLKESKEAGTPPLIVQDLVDLLQYHTTTYFDNEVSGIPQAHHRSGRPLKTLTQRLKGKEGRFRGSLSGKRVDFFDNEVSGIPQAHHRSGRPLKTLTQRLRGKEGRFRGSLSGKRVDFSSRTVISPDPNLDLSEVGVPETVAMKLTIPEIITAWNIERMKKLVINGPNKFPGVNYIVRPDGVKIRLDFVEDRSTVADNLEIGYLVERHISNGDIVMFNRQPSLHQMSIMAHYVRVLPGKTFRLHPSVCPPYNADFDGDTMSVMVPIGKEAIEEARQMIPSQILFKHGDNSLMPSLSQDYLYGLYELSQITKGKTKKRFATFAQAKDSGLSWTELFSLAGKNMTIGQYMLNSELPPEMKDYTRRLNRKVVNQILTELGKKHPKFVEEVFNSWKDLGATYSYLNGNTISITDFAISHSYRDKILKTELPKLKDLKGDARVDAMNAMTRRVQLAQDKALSKTNNIYKMLTAGSFNKPDSVRQILSMPGVMTDIENKPLPTPVTRSYGEGLDTRAYYNTMYSARKGTVDRSVNTQQTGALTKDILNVARRFLVVEIDCGTKDGLEFDLNDKNLLDRTMLITIPKIGKRNDVIETNIILKAKLLGLKTLWARSPLTCESVDGVCQMCYGLLPNGQFAPLGTNVGILDSEALTERATQLTMQTFHTGGSVLGGGGIHAGFPRLEQLVKVPERLGGKATLSEIRGVVKSILKNQTGGYNLTVENKMHVVPAGRKPIVEIGQTVMAGDPLSDGVIKPQELGALRSHLDAQKYIVDQASNIYGGDFYNKTFETIIRSISDNAVVTTAPDDSGFLRGDTTTISYLKRLNKMRKIEGLEPIKYREYFKSVQTLNTDSQDWLTKVTTNRVKAALTTGAAKGMYANIKGRDPIPAYLYGEEFGRNTNYAKGEFY